MGHGKQNRIVSIYGMKGYGKSFKLEEENGLKPRVLWFDPFGLYKDYDTEDFRAIFPGWVRSSNLAEVVIKIAGVLNPWLLRLAGRPWRTPPAKDFRIMYDVPEEEEENEEGHLAELYRALRLRYERLDEYGPFSPGHSTIVVDEVDGLNRGNGIPSKTVAKMVKRGRHILLDQWYATRRPFEIPRLVSSQSNVKYLFRIEEKRDLVYLKEAGVPADIIAALPNTVRGEYYRIEPEGNPRISHWAPAAPV